MVGNINLVVVTPEKIVVNEDASIVEAPGALGEFGVLVGHTPFMSSLKVGALKYKDKDNKERVVFVSGGFAEVLPDKVTVLADSAERRRDIDANRAKSALERAQRRIDTKSSADVNFIRAKTSLERA
ncbi:MAG: F0F1 ATP synthase subunit epsilon, partial [Desulfobacterales bacterium]|nr:F0F1 ATP synthase subunit epsilon [Desulfobacterales bacterium]